MSGPSTDDSARIHTRAAYLTAPSVMPAMK
jgi:hypothetical protein